MKKDVLITIKGVQITDDDKDTTELFTQGTLYKKNGSYYLAYDETESTGFEGCRTTLKIEGQDKVSLIRYGKTRSNLVVERDNRNVGFYDTMQGALVIGVSAGKIENKLTQNGGTLSFQYTLDINSSHVSDNEVYVSVREMS